MQTIRHIILFAKSHHDYWLSGLLSELWHQANVRTICRPLTIPKGGDRYFISEFSRRVSKCIWSTEISRVGCWLFDLFEVLCFRNRTVRSIAAKIYSNCDKSVCVVYLTVSVCTFYKENEVAEPSVHGICEVSARKKSCQIWIEISLRATVTQFIFAAGATTVACLASTIQETEALSMLRR